MTTENGDLVIPLIGLAGPAVMVPNVAGFVGLRLGWQAVCYGPVTGLQASIPAIVSVH